MDSGMSTYDLYEDMKSRTNGEIYIGVVGPVRTGKSRNHYRSGQGMNCR